LAARAEKDGETKHRGEEKASLFFDLDGEQLGAEGGDDDGDAFNAVVYDPLNCSPPRV